MEGIWRWILAYAFVLLAVQFAVYYYRRQYGQSQLQASVTGDGSSGQKPGPPQTEWDEEFPERRSGDDPVSDDDIERVTPPSGFTRCLHCGAANEREAAFRYCWQCASELGP